MMVVSTGVLGAGSGTAPTKSQRGSRKPLLLAYIGRKMYIASSRFNAACDKRCRVEDPRSKRFRSTIPGCSCQCTVRWTAVHLPAAAQEDGVGEQLPQLRPRLVNRHNKGGLADNPRVLQQFVRVSLNGGDFFRETSYMPCHV